MSYIWEKTNKKPEGPLPKFKPYNNPYNKKAIQYALPNPHPHHSLPTPEYARQYIAQDNNAPNYKNSVAPHIQLPAKQLKIQQGTSGVPMALPLPPERYNSYTK